MKSFPIDVPSQIHDCPFCHAEGLKLKTDTNGCFYIHCEHCQARGPAVPDETAARILPLTFKDNLLRVAADESPNFVFCKDRNGKFLMCNKAMAHFYDTEPYDMIGKTDADFNLNETQVKTYLESVQEIITSGKTQIVYESSTNARTGQVHHFQSVKKPIIGPDGHPIVLITANDITELQNMHNIVEENERRYRYAMDASHSGIWDWDINTNQVVHNSRWCEIVGLDHKMLCHSMDVLGPIVYAPDQERMMAAVTAALQGDGHYYSEHRMQRPDGTIVWVYDRGKVVEYDEQGNPKRMAGSIIDITQDKLYEHELEKKSRELEYYSNTLELLVNERTQALEEAIEKLQSIAVKDHLTGIGNRTMLEQWLKNQDINKQLTVTIIDLDYFKSINDKYGHQCGDTVLTSAVECFSNNVRSSDLLIRWGGEEFLLLLDSASVEQTAATAEKLRTELEKIKMLPNGGCVTASFGVCSTQITKDKLEQGIKEADNAVYQAKRGGRNRVRVYIPDEFNG